MESVEWQSELCSLHFYSYILMCKCSLLSRAYIIRASSTVLPRRGTAAPLPIAAAGKGQDCSSSLITPGPVDGGRTSLPAQPPYGRWGPDLPCS